MLYNLSAKCPKEIALAFLSLFFIAGIGSLKAEAFSYNYGLPNTYFPNSKTSSFGTKVEGVMHASSKNRYNEKLKKIAGAGKLENLNLALQGNTSAGSSPDNPVIKTIKAENKNIKKTWIGGPGQPEMSAFKPVGADNMVDAFTGDFSYNVPLLDVGGYPVNMFYNSGITMDQEASWLGLGWNINPGTIMRNMRGLPDDFNGTDLITKRQSMKPDKTWGISAGAGAKFAGFPLGVGLDVNAGLSFNNKLGLALEAGIHPSLSISASAGDQKTAALSFGANLNLSSRNGASVTPSVNISLTKADAESGTSTTGSLGLSYTQTSRAGVTGLHLDAALTKSMKTYENTAAGYYKESSVSGTMAALSSSLSFAYPAIIPSIKNIFTRRSYNLSFSVGSEWYALNGYARLAGFYTETFIGDDDKLTTHPAYGMLNYQKANNNPLALLDFNRANDGVYTPKSPAIALPVYTYDIFSINGEGTGGSFRATRNDLGYMRDAFVKTREDAGSLGLDLGFGNTVHGGAEFSYANTPSQVGGWGVNNIAKNVFQFQENNAAYQSVYFKNPGEKTIPDANYQTSIGGENLVRLKMSNTGTGTPSLLPRLVRYDAGKNVLDEKNLTMGSVIRPGRDKRTQVISFLSAEEASKIGFDKKIYSYATDSTKVIFGAACNKTGIDSFDRFVANPMDADRKSHHISEIDVLGTDGRKYVYGIPVYNTRQVDVSFSISNGDKNTGKSIYTPNVDDAAGNQQGRDWYMNQEEMPAYAHSFLLTALVSPNYVDVTGDGITEDDMGDAVKFNYTRFNQGYKWRTPIGNVNSDGTSTAAYSEGLKTDNKDDKAHYVYGERELWHLYTIESKNMVARFYVKNDRLDCKQVLGQSGGLDVSWGMQRLDKICLFSKGDLMKLGSKAKPIKTVRFFQSYKLCKNTDGSGSSVGTNGKLTLDSIWISYNGNIKPKSKYVFYYPADKNPDYGYNANDRWGNYKPVSNTINNNPGALSNADYPYSIQDKTKADNYASSWVMNKILLPSGGVIGVDFESDDYAYVQNKKAANMFGIVGFGSKPNPSLAEQANPYLYPFNNAGAENNYIYVQLTNPVTSANLIIQQRELAARYFENTTQVFMKLAVTMPLSPGLAGSELIPVYADINNFGIVPGTGGNVAYIQVKILESGSTPMVQQSLQFLKQQLPGKAYPGYDVSDNSSAKGVVIALAGMITSFAGLVKGEDVTLKQNNSCREIVTAKSFMRLTNPLLIKYGGGLRVKRVTISDNWNKMTQQYGASYGQEYRYTKTELINGKLNTISSGVASWEPSIGGDENPHKEIMRYMDHNKSGPYDFGAIEMPLGEMFYPSPLVGYSRVEVLSINRDTVKNLPTRQVTEFYTTRDFPFQSSCTQLTDPEANVSYQPSPIKQLLHLDMKKSITQSQGFLVDMNDMNGKIKIQATYSALDSITATSYTQNFYNVQQATDKTYKFNHTFPTISKPDGVVDNTTLIGRDIELMADFREHKTETITTNISVNFDFFFLGIFPIPLTNLLQPTIYEGTTYRSASLLKVVNHYGMLDSVVVVDKGSMISTKNLVYDAETGNPLLTRTNNEHNKPVYNFSYPAHWAYSGMGPAYKNIDATYTALTFRNGKLETPIDMSIFESGDELYVMAKNNRGPVRNSPCDGPLPGRLPKNKEKKIWAVNTIKGGSSSPQFIFMDRYGNPYTAYDVSMRIVRSGHRNMLDQTVASITSLKNPVNDLTGLLDFSDVTNIVQTTAATFKDHWRVDNSFYQFDSTIIVNTYAKIKLKTYYINQAAEVIGQVDNGRVEGIYKILHDPTSITARCVSYKRYDGFNYDAWINFDMRTNMPADLANPSINIIKGSLSLFAHVANNWDPYRPENENYGHEYEAYGKDHTSSWSNVTRGTQNDVMILGMRSAWPSTDDMWKQLFTDQSRILHNWSNIGYIPSTPDKSYFNYAIGGGADKRISIPPPVIKEMLSNASNPENTFATGFRVMQMRKNPGDEKANRKKDISQCFIGSKINFAGKPGFSFPTLSIYYYNCGDTTTSSFNDGDPLVNQLRLCGQAAQLLTECRSKFTKKAINPYVEGVLGNWRIDTTYAYYGDRKESDPNINADTRIAGTIINFKKFWNFNANYLQRNFAASDVWVWNSTITQYNRKGYEIENKDPLGRFNAGLYGYNQQLPIAVANNARVREIMFDGFEDYDYETALNCINCKPHRHANFNAVTNYIDTTQRHTGRYSLRVEGATSIDLKAPVTNAAEADKGYGLRIKIDSTAFTDTLVTMKGSGLRGKYYNYPRAVLDICAIAAVSAAATLNNGVNPVIKQNEQAYFPHDFTFPAGIISNNFTVRWEGSVQPIVSGYYNFQLMADDGFNLKIVDKNNNVVVPTTQRWDCNWPYGKSVITSVPLIKGELYKITFDYFENDGSQFVDLLWKVPGSTSFNAIPLNQLYSPENLPLAIGTVTYPTGWCTRLDTVQVYGNALTDSFSLIQGRKMVLSAWVKEVSTDCKKVSYLNNSIAVSYTNSSQTESWLPTGNIIEGWQRYESIFTVPATATAIRLSLKNNNASGGDRVFFDDVRIHPFNANLKSFVYHSSSLRLMAELDENNYASFYEYDDDGTLTRVKKETINGIKTITETRSAMQKNETLTLPN